MTAAGAWFTYHAVELVHGILLVGYPKQVGLPAVDQEDRDVVTDLSDRG